MKAVWHSFLVMGSSRPRRSAKCSLTRYFVVMNAVGLESLKEKFGNGWGGFWAICWVSISCP